MQQSQENVHAQNYAVCCSVLPMTRQHSYDEYSLDNGYAYSMVYRYIFRNILYYSLSICIPIGYLWKKSHYRIFPVFKIFSGFSKNYDLSIPGCISATGESTGQAD